MAFLLHKRTLTHDMSVENMLVDDFMNIINVLIGVPVSNAPPFLGQIVKDALSFTLLQLKKVQR